MERTNSVAQRNTSCVHIKLTFLKCAIQLSHCLIEVDLKQTKCKQPHKWHFCVEKNIFFGCIHCKSGYTTLSYCTEVRLKIWTKKTDLLRLSCWFKSPTWSRKSPSGEAWKPVQAPNMASTHGTIVEMSVFKGFKLWSFSQLIVLFRRCRRVKQWEENIALFSQVREPFKKGSRPIHSLILVSSRNAPPH